MTSLDAILSQYEKNTENTQREDNTISMISQIHCGQEGERYSPMYSVLNFTGPKQSMSRLLKSQCR